MGERVLSWGEGNKPSVVQDIPFKSSREKGWTLHAQLSILGFLMKESSSGIGSHECWKLPHTESDHWFI